MSVTAEQTGPFSHVPAIEPAKSWMPFGSLRRIRRFYDVVAAIVVVLVVLFAMGPIVWTVLTSFKTEGEIVSRSFTWLPKSLNIENYQTLWERSGYPRLLRNSAIVTGLTVLMSITIGTVAAYSISRYRFRGRSGLMIFYLVIRMFPFTLLLIPLFIMLRNLGLFDSHFGLALTYTTFLLPLCVWMLKGFFDGIPPDLEEASRVDGSTRLGALVRIVLPLARQGIAATTVFIAIGAWNEYVWALLLTTANGARTWPVGLQLMVGEFQMPWGVLSASGIISIIPIIIGFAIVQRALVSGLMAGGVKG
ncbi:MAG: carbohydrate ABC transporter permease [Thermomicrobiales bacterium]|nr:carbohydrate ABC transporter permease [Thermomicrobiales bacterium]